MTLVTINLEQDSTYLHTYTSYLHLLQVHHCLFIGSLVLHCVHFLIVCNTINLSSYNSLSLQHSLKYLCIALPVTLSNVCIIFAPKNQEFLKQRC